MRVSLHLLGLPVFSVEWSAGRSDTDGDVQIVSLKSLLGEPAGDDDDAVDLDFGFQPGA